MYNVYCVLCIIMHAAIEADYKLTVSTVCLPRERLRVAKK